MLPDRVSNPGPLTYESGALPIALRGPALSFPDHNSETNRNILILLGRTGQYGVSHARMTTLFICPLINILLHFLSHRAI